MLPAYPTPRHAAAPLSAPPELPSAPATAVYQSLQSLLAQMPVAMYLLRGPAQVLDLVNVPAAAAWGCSVEQVRGKPFFEALPHLRGQGYEAAHATVWHTQQAVAWQAWPVAGGHRPGRGYFDVSFQPFYEEPGRPAGILVTSQDVTAQVLARQHAQQAAADLVATNAGLADCVAELTHAAHAAQGYAEAQATILAQLLEQVPLAVGLLVGPDYVVQVCNPSLLALWQRPLAQVLHQPLFEVLPALRWQGLHELLDEVGRSGVPTVGALLPGPGAPAFVYHPLRDAQGRSVAIAAVAAGPFGAL